MSQVPPGDVRATLEVLQHALGVDEYGRGTMFRGHYVAGPGHHSYETCRTCVEHGLMVEKRGTALSGGDPVFLVTDAGRAFVRDNSPPPPKLTPGQKRYRQFLDADSGMRFGEWLRLHARQTHG